MGYFTEIYAQELPHRAKAVYMYLKDRSNKDGQCYPSIGTVARELQLSRRTVERAIDDLVRAGFITKTVLAGERWAEQPAFYAERPLNLKKEMPPRGKCALLAA